MIISPRSLIEISELEKLLSGKSDNDVSGFRAKIAETIWVGKMNAERRKEANVMLNIDNTGSLFLSLYLRGSNIIRRATINDTVPYQAVSLKEYEF